MPAPLRIDIPELVDRCRSIAGAVDGGSELLEAADVLEKMQGVVESMPDVVEANRRDAIYTTSMSIAEAADRVARQYEEGEAPLSTPGTALHQFAASVRKAIQIKREDASGATLQ